MTPQVRPGPPHERLTASDLPILREVPGHAAAVPFFLTADMFGGLPIEIAGGEISSSVGAHISDPHVHDVPEIYLLLSPRRGEAVVEITVEGRKLELESPGVYYVPAGVTHSFVTRRAAPGSYCLGILVQPTTLDASASAWRNERLAGPTT